MYCDLWLFFLYCAGRFSQRVTDTCTGIPTTCWRRRRVRSNTRTVTVTSWCLGRWGRNEWTVSSPGNSTVSRQYVFFLSTFKTKFIIDILILISFFFFFFNLLHFFLNIQVKTQLTRYTRYKKIPHSYTHNVSVPALFCYVCNKILGSKWTDFFLYLNL